MEARDNAKQQLAQQFEEHHHTGEPCVIATTTTSSRSLEGDFHTCASDFHFEQQAFDIRHEGDSQVVLLLPEPMVPIAWLKRAHLASTLQVSTFCVRSSVGRYSIGKPNRKLWSLSWRQA